MATLAVAAGLAFGGMGATAARAADLGGDCCADLEERVAELEATTVRHGNRKVSLTISGWVNVALLYWDEDAPGGTGDVYVANSGTNRSRIDFKGDGKINGDTSAGYRLQIRPWGDVTSAQSQIVHSPSRDGIAVRNVYVFLKSKAAGEVRLGLMDAASDDAWYIDLGGSTVDIANNDTADWIGAFQLRTTAGALSGVTWSKVTEALSDSSIGRIMYISPTWQGFSIKASWGGNDTSAIGAYYDNTFGSVRIAAGVAYDVSTGLDAIGSQQVGTGLVNAIDDTLEKVAASGSIYEKDSGLFATVNYGIAYADIAGRDDATNVYAKLGWRKNVNGLGETALYGEYDRSSNVRANDIDATMWGVGVTQDLDAVGAMTYLGYRHYELEDDLSATIQAQDIQAVMSGMQIKF